MDWSERIVKYWIKKIGDLAKFQSYKWGNVEQKWYEIRI